MRNAREGDFTTEEIDVLGAALAHPKARGDDRLHHFVIFGLLFLRMDAAGKQERRRDGSREKSTKQTMFVEHRSSRNAFIGAR